MEEEEEKEKLKTEKEDAKFIAQVEGSEATKGKKERPHIKKSGKKYMAIENGVAAGV